MGRDWNLLHASMVTRRRLLAGTLGLAGSALVAACGSDDDDNSNSAGAQPEATATDVADSEGSSENTPTPEQDGDGETRIFSHYFGETEVPVYPQRIVTTQDQNGLLPLLELGVRPIASAALQREDGTFFFRRVESYDVSDIETVGTYGEPDLELIAAQRPDLIVAHEFNEDIYDQLSAIAPTVAIQIFERPLTEVLYDFADLVGKVDRWEELNAEYAEAIEALKEDLPRPAEEIVLSYVQFGNDGTFYIGGNWQATGTVLVDLEIGRPEPQVAPEALRETYSLEQLIEHDGDVMITGDFSGDEGQENPAISAARESPVFQSLDVVQRGEFHVFDGTLTVGSAFEKMSNFIDFLRSILVERQVNFADGSGDMASFPVAIEHKFGTTEIAVEPQRVIALGYNEQDAILALGVKPIAVRYWFGDEPHAIFPWAQDEAGDAEPEVLEMTFGELDFEAIAALEPDFISAVYSGITEQEYETLSRIAPTLAQSADHIDFGMPWDEMTLSVGRALGRERQATDLVEGVKEQFNVAREAHPEWEGKTVVVGAPRGDGQFGFVASEDARARVFTRLGFVVPEELDEIAGEQFWGEISLERADLLDQDLIVFHQMAWVEGGREAIESDPLLSQLDAMKEGRVLYVEGTLDDALQFGTVLSLPFLLDNIVPMLEAAMDGDPDTEVTS